MRAMLIGLALLATALALALGWATGRPPAQPLTVTRVSTERPLAETESHRLSGFLIVPVPPIHVEMSVPLYHSCHEELESSTSSVAKICSVIVSVDGSVSRAHPRPSSIPLLECCSK